MRNVRLWLIAAAVLLVFLALVIRVLVAGHGALADGRAALAEGNRVAAQNHFLRAARWYLPLVGSTHDAVEELIALGDQWQADQEYAWAVAAYDDARGALYSTAWLPGPDADLLQRADAGYAAALARWQQSRKPETDVEGATARFRELAANARRPNPWWSLLMGLAFCGYIGALGLLAWRWERRDTRRWPILAAAGGSFVLWLVALIFT